MANSKNSLLGFALLGAAAYLFRNKESRDKVMNQIQSLVPQETRDKVKNQVRTLKDNVTGNAGKNSENVVYPSQPNEQALTTAEQMNEQTGKFIDPNNKEGISEVEVKNP
ncbi:hypothetical protein [Peribacillus sp. SCS-155]|uniref:hypothetical protein n=1 Tax=Peribacillus sedimenti TaxID=3115297 RepID=UPI0039067FC1